MSLTKRPNGRWQVYFTHPDGRRIREIYDTQAEAIQREADLRIEVLQGEETPIAPGLSLGQLRQQVIERVWAGSKAEKSSALNAQLAVDYFGAALPVRDITTAHIDRWIAELVAKGNSNATINRKIAALSKMLSFAKDREYIAQKPKLERMREGRGRIRFMADDEEGKVLALLKLWGRLDEHDAVVFLLDTGARVGEMLSLKWEDGKGGRVTFWDTKNHQPRSVPLTVRAKAMLAARRERVTFDRAPFSSLTYWQLHATWERVRDHLGFAQDKQFVLHMLRHTCASRLVQRGADIRRVKEWLGHKSINVTMRYAHLSPDSLDSMTALLEKQQDAPAPRHLAVVEREKL